MIFQSQAGQDRFVYDLAVCGEGRLVGAFLDVGCADPVVYSNTYALERVGWRGLLVDVAPHLAALIQEKRVSPFLCADATTVDWKAVVDRYALPNVVDYLSFDLDGAGATAIERVPWDTLRFRILTVEHDAYRFGDGPRQSMRALLRRHGYELLCPDVCNDDQPFEDWWVDPKVVDMTVAEKFRRSGPTAWTEIVGP